MGAQPKGNPECLKDARQKRLDLANVLRWGRPNPPKAPQKGPNPPRVPPRISPGRRFRDPKPYSSRRPGGVASSRAGSACPPAPSPPTSRREAAGRRRTACTDCMTVVLARITSKFCVAFTSAATPFQSWAGLGARKWECLETSRGLRAGRRRGGWRITRSWWAASAVGREGLVSIRREAA